MIAVRALADLFPEQRRAILDRPSVLTDDIVRGAAEIVRQVRERGDGAVRDLTDRFDGVRLAVLRVGDEEFARAETAVSSEDRRALEAMRDRVTHYHEHGLLEDFEHRDSGGVLGRVVVPYDRAGLYVPGGRAAYPSSLIMAAVPAVVAGVPEVVLCTPPGPDGRVPAGVLVAARLCGVRSVFKIGGAQAVAAMACGTQSVPRCGIIAGPGNAWVTAAKLAVSRAVAIDFLAGPTEILVVSDGSANPAWIAADLVAQAEHDPLACCLLVTTDRAQADAVAAELVRQTPSHPRADVIRRALEGRGAILVAPTLDDAVAFANDYGAEHLVLACREPRRVLDSVRHAGAVFLGEHAPVAAGDYGIGPNAILPTLGDARRVPGLSANTFRKAITFAGLDAAGLREWAPTATALARLEGLDAHRRSIEIRLEE